MNSKRSNAIETQSSVSGVSKGTNKSGIAHDKHCLAPECHMKMISGKHWGKHVKTETHGGKTPGNRRCNGEGCLYCEEMKEMKEKKGKFFCRAHFEWARSHFEWARSHFEWARSHFEWARSHFEWARSHFEWARLFAQLIISDLTFYHRK
jgi:hypothetical protein